MILPDESTRNLPPLELPEVLELLLEDELELLLDVELELEELLLDDDELEELLELDDVVPLPTQAGSTKLPSWLPWKPNEVL